MGVPSICLSNPEPVHLAQIGFAFGQVLVEHSHNDYPQLYRRSCRASPHYAKSGADSQVEVPAGRAFVGPSYRKMIEADHASPEIGKVQDCGRNTTYLCSDLCQSRLNGCPYFVLADY